MESPLVIQPLRKSDRSKRDAARTPPACAASRFRVPLDLQARATLAGLGGGVVGEGFMSGAGV